MNALRRRLGVVYVRTRIKLYYCVVRARKDEIIIIIIIVKRKKRTCYSIGRPASGRSYPHCSRTYQKTRRTRTDWVTDDAFFVSPPTLLQETKTTLTDPALNRVYIPYTERVFSMLELGINTFLYIFRWY